MMYILARVLNSNAFLPPTLPGHPYGRKKTRWPYSARNFIQVFANHAVRCLVFKSLQYILFFHPWNENLVFSIEFIELIFCERVGFLLILKLLLFTLTSFIFLFCLRRM